jgi:hypothetical protein
MGSRLRSRRESWPRKGKPTIRTWFHRPAWSSKADEAGFGDSSRIALRGRARPPPAGWHRRNADP